MAKARGDFTGILLQKKIISSEQIVEARTLQQQTGTRLQDAIVKLGFATAEEVVAAIAEFHGLQFVDLTEITIPQAVVELVPESIARENVVLPLSQENGIVRIILSDPSDLDTVQKLQFMLDMDIQPVLAPREQIIEAINRHYGQMETENEDAWLREFDDDAIEIEFDEPGATSAPAAQDDIDPRVVKLVDLIIEEAISLWASEIHIEPFCDRVRVRYRIDGILVERFSAPRLLLDPLLSRIKFMSNIAVSERPQPHDGRIKTDVRGRQFDLRVSILPTQLGESVVIRIPNRISIEALGLDQDDDRRFRQIISRPHGLFLATGPVGSGKTTTVYAALNHLSRPDRRIIAAEDPVEDTLPCIAQFQINHDLTFANTLQSILRQAPDIILVGEIRDHATAQIAVQAALSGRMVFGTLPTTNDAPSAISRLVEIGVEPFLIASSVTAIMAQRMLRVVCPKCKEPDEPPTAEIRAAGITPDRIATATFMRGRGCNYCRRTGYRGRSGVFEMFKLNAAIREMIFNREPTQSIRRQARSLGMRTLLEDGVNKALMGITTLEQVLSTCHHELETDATAS